MSPSRYALVALLAAGCTGRADKLNSAALQDTNTAVRTAKGVTRVAEIIDFHGPESVKYDADQDMYFVSNMLGYGSVKDGNGYISKVGAASINEVTNFIIGGQNGVTLHAPKGMAIHGDTLWVADIDALRAFHRKTGAPLATIDFTALHVVMLNDVAIGPDDRIYTTDTGIQMSPKGVVRVGDEKIFVVSGGTPSIYAAGPQLNWPNGIAWDTRGGRWLVVGFDDYNSKLYALKPGDSVPTTLATGKGRWDGVEPLGDGRILVTSWSDSSLHVVSGNVQRQIVRQIPAPADIAIDTRRNRVAVPLPLADRVEVYALPR